METEAIEIFFSFIAADQEFYHLIKQHLVALRRTGKISCWSYLDATGKEDIQEHLEKARIIVVLISTAYLDSDYHYEGELATALRRHAAGEARMLPILVRPGYYEGLPFTRLQMLPPKGIPLSEWPVEQKDLVYRNIVDAIHQVFTYRLPTGQAPTS